MRIVGLKANYLFRSLKIISIKKRKKRMKKFTVHQ
jgi:hypothetical protein